MKDMTGPMSPEELAKWPYRPEEEKACLVCGRPFIKAELFGTVYSELTGGRGRPRHIRLIFAKWYHEPEPQSERLPNRAPPPPFCVMQVWGRPMETPSRSGSEDWAEAVKP